MAGVGKKKILDVIGTNEENPTENHTNLMVSEIYTKQSIKEEN
jgi:hypothetical protein